ncbi:MAG TPA: hypothetical protein DDZ83_19745 [Nitrospinae bacterium]|nr:hypothetical protein [Nitrospinota bacterium]
MLQYTDSADPAAGPDEIVVFDTIGGKVHARSFSVQKAGGRLVHIAAGLEGFEPPRGDVTATRPYVARDRQHFDRITALMEQGAVRPPEITRMSLAEAGAAQDLSQTGHVRGKIVFDARCAFAADTHARIPKE